MLSSTPNWKLSRTTKIDISSTPLLWNKTLWKVVTTKSGRPVKLLLPSITSSSWTSWAAQSGKFARNCYVVGLPLDRNDVASCLQVAYDKISTAEATKMLLFKDESELRSFVQEVCIIFLVVHNIHDLDLTRTTVAQLAHWRQHCLIYSRESWRERGSCRTFDSSLTEIRPRARENYLSIRVSLLLIFSLWINRTPSCNILLNAKWRGKKR